MKRLLNLPLVFIYFFIECKNSPVSGKKIGWRNMFTFMIKVRLLSIISGGKRDISASFLSYRLYASDYKSLEYLFHEIFVLGEYHYAGKDYNPAVIYDCGANIGMTMLFFKIMYPEAKVVSFEPNPSAFYYLKKNIDHNRFKNVFAHQVALSDSNGELDLYFDDDTLVTGSLDQERERFGKSVKVKAAKLSDFYAQESKIDLLKMDVEGAEHFIMQELVKSNMLLKPERYLIEYHNHEKLDEYRSFLSIFAESKYKVQFVSSINRNKTFQDILIHLY